MSYTTITDETDPLTLISGIFISGADTLSPVAIYPEIYPQSLEEACNATKNHPSQWMSCAAIAGIAQYSLKHSPAGVLARWDIHFRHPDDYEMREDVQNFGNQVIGDKISGVPDDEKEKFKNNAIFYPFDDKEAFYFTGPPRVRKSVFLTRVFPGELPESLDDFVGQIKLAQDSDKSNPMVIPQCYQFLHATDGKLVYSPFALEKTNEYNPDNLKPYGHVEIANGEMNYFPPGKENHPIDFTENLHRG